MEAYKLFRNAVSLGMWGDYMQRPVSKYVPGLTAVPWHDPTKYDVVKVLEGGMLFVCLFVYLFVYRFTF